jgi:hypothetical protein
MKPKDASPPTNDPEVIQGARMYLRDNVLPSIRKQSLSREYKNPKRFVKAMMDTITEGDISQKFSDGDWQPVAESMLMQLWQNQNKMRVKRP